MGFSFSGVLPAIIFIGTVVGLLGYIISRNFNVIIVDTSAFGYLSPHILRSPALFWPWLEKQTGIPRRQILWVVFVFESRRPEKTRGGGGSELSTSKRLTFESGLHHVHRHMAERLASEPKFSSVFSYLECDHMVSWLEELFTAMGYRVLCILHDSDPLVITGNPTFTYLTPFRAASLYQIVNIGINYIQSVMAISNLAPHDFTEPGKSVLHKIGVRPRHFIVHRNGQLKTDVLDQFTDPVWDETTNSLSADSAEKMINRLREDDQDSVALADEDVAWAVAQVKEADYLRLQPPAAVCPFKRSSDDESALAVPDLNGIVIMPACVRRAFSLILLPRFSLHPIPTTPISYTDTQKHMLEETVCNLLLLRDGICPSPPGLTVTRDEELAALIPCIRVLIEIAERLKTCPQKLALHLRGLKPEVCKQFRRYHIPPYSLHRVMYVFGDAGVVPQFQHSPEKDFAAYEGASSLALVYGTTPEKQSKIASRIRKLLLVLHNPQFITQTKLMGILTTHRKTGSVVYDDSPDDDPEFEMVAEHLSHLEAAAGTIAVPDHLQSCVEQAQAQIAEHPLDTTVSNPEIARSLLNLAALTVVQLSAACDAGDHAAYELTTHRFETLQTEVCIYVGGDSLGPCALASSVLGTLPALLHPTVRHRNADRLGPLSLLTRTPQLLDLRVSDADVKHLSAAVYLVAQLWNVRNEEKPQNFLSFVAEYCTDASVLPKSRSSTVCEAVRRLVASLRTVDLVQKLHIVEEANVLPIELAGICRNHPRLQAWANTEVLRLPEDLYSRLNCSRTESTVGRLPAQSCVKITEILTSALLQTDPEALQHSVPSLFTHGGTAQAIVEAMPQESHGIVHSRTVMTMFALSLDAVFDLELPLGPRLLAEQNVLRHGWLATYFAALHDIETLSPLLHDLLPRYAKQYLSKPECHPEGTTPLMIAPLWTTMVELSCDLTGSLTPELYAALWVLSLAHLMSTSHRNRGGAGTSSDALHPSRRRLIIGLREVLPHFQRLTGLPVLKLAKLSELINLGCDDDSATRAGDDRLSLALIFVAFCLASGHPRLENFVHWQLVGKADPSMRMHILQLIAMLFFGGRISELTLEESDQISIADCPKELRSHLVYLAHRLGRTIMGLPVEAEKRAAPSEKVLKAKTNEFVGLYKFLRCGFNQSVKKLKKDRELLLGMEIERVEDKDKDTGDAQPDPALLRDSSPEVFAELPSLADAFHHRDSDGRVVAHAKEFLRRIYWMESDNGSKSLPGQEEEFLRNCLAMAEAEMKQISGLSYPLDPEAVLDFVRSPDFL
ncbi:hypothetical protein C8F01DRAFT_305813 [Mycena amicta]|nr:hypothetical protein C8F01DRAFT_305813 [Mycena amicta]